MKQENIVSINKNITVIERLRDHCKTITEAKKRYFSNQFDHPVTDVLDIWSTVHIIAIHCHRIVNFDFDKV